MAQRLGARECPEETVWPWLIVVVVVPDWDAVMHKNEKSPKQKHQKQKH